jgi:hypothetical protein
MAGILEFLTKPITATAGAIAGGLLPYQQKLLEMRGDVVARTQAQLADRLAEQERLRAQAEADRVAPGIARALGALPEARGQRGQTPSVGSGWENLPPELASTMQLLMNPATRQLGEASAMQLLTPQGRGELWKTAAQIDAANMSAEKSRLDIEQARLLGPANLAATQALEQSRLAAARASEASAAAASAGKIDQVGARLNQRWLAQIAAPVAVQDSMQQIDAALVTGDSLGALAAVIKLAKILDPTSVVREGEVTTVEGGVGIADQLVRAYNKLKGDGFSEAGARQLQQTAVQVAFPVLTRGRQLTAEFRAMAEAAGVNERDVVGGVGWDDAYVTQIVKRARRGGQ